MSWQPWATVQDAHWRPYTLGRWAYTDDGWTWISDEPFGWITYHYGRWMRTRNLNWGLDARGSMGAGLGSRGGTAMISSAGRLCRPRRGLTGPRASSSGRTSSIISAPRITSSSRPVTLATRAWPRLPFLRIKRNRFMTRAPMTLTCITIPGSGRSSVTDPTYDFIRYKTRRPLGPRLRLMRTGFHTDGKNNGAVVSGGTIEIAAPRVLPSAGRRNPQDGPP